MERSSKEYAKSLDGMQISKLSFCFATRIVLHRLLLVLESFGDVFVHKPDFFALGEAKGNLTKFPQRDLTLCVDLRQPVSDRVLTLHKNGSCEITQ